MRAAGALAKIPIAGFAALAAACGVLTIVAPAASAQPPQPPPTVTTTLVPGDTVTVGTGVHDTAMVTATTGSIQYRYYGAPGAFGHCNSDTQLWRTNGTSPGGGDPGGGGTITGGTVPPSGTVDNLTPGTYYWAAFYQNGNVYAASDCRTEQLIVRPEGTPTVTTTLSDTDVPEGTPVYDTATVNTTPPVNPANTRYFYYSGGNALDHCDNDTTGWVGGDHTQPSGVAAGTGQESDHVTLPPGTYYWAAFYNHQNVYAASDCGSEELNVNAITVTTKLEPRRIVRVGTHVYDTVKVTSDDEPITEGSIEYRYYSGLAGLAACLHDTKEWAENGATPGGVDPGVSELISDTFPRSKEVTLDPGIYFWAAFYSNKVNDENDENEVYAASNCIEEFLKVRKYHPRIFTELSEHVIKTGERVRDEATLIRKSEHAGGHVNYRYYPSFKWCKIDTAQWPNDDLHGHDAGTREVEDGHVRPSDEVKFNEPGTYYWAAFYSGDEHNKPAASKCIEEVLKVKKHRPRIFTRLSEHVIKAGERVRDEATLVGASEHAGGYVRYRYYPSLYWCEIDTAKWPDRPRHGHSAGFVRVRDGHVRPSRDVKFYEPGTYYWAAFYSGDRHNEAAASKCIYEFLRVRKHDPYIVTELSEHVIKAGERVFDEAALVGASRRAGGHVSYRYYPSLRWCEIDTAKWPDPPRHGHSAGTVRVRNRRVRPSRLVKFDEPGTFYWAAFYTGDDYNNAAASKCRTEKLIVVRRRPHVFTELSRRVIKAGERVRDEARLDDATRHARGYVKYRYYPSLYWCKTDTAKWPDRPRHGHSAGTVKVYNGHVPHSQEVKFYKPGTYYWAAFYTGDRSNKAAASDCDDEVLVVFKVRKHHPRIFTKLSGHVIKSGEHVQDRAWLDDASRHARGYVKYRYYPSLEWCKIDTRKWPKQPRHGYSAGIVKVRNGKVPPSRRFRFYEPGTYYWAAFYSGDRHNKAAASKCWTEKLIVLPKKKPWHHWWHGHGHLDPNVAREPGQAANL